MNIKFAELIFYVMMVHEVGCRSNGAPPSACSDMTPRHHNVPQSRPAPYSISVSKNTYKPGEQIIVTLQANSGVTFKGFLIQSRRDPNTNDTVGTFIPAQGTKNTCSNQASLTQLDASLKRKLSLIWIAPSTPVGNVVFVATFVQNMSTYWVKVQGPSVIPQVPPPPPLPLATTSSTTPKPAISTNIKITTLPTAITSAHTQLIDTTTISTTKLTTPTTAISTELADTTTISTTKLTTPTTTLPTNLADTTTVSTTKLTTPPTTISVELADTTTISTTKLTAITTTLPTNLADTTTVAPSNPTTIYESLATGIQLTTTPTGAKDNKDLSGFGASCLDHGCGITKGCFHDCNDGASWTFLVTWKDNGGGSVDFEMKAKIPVADNYWVSLGLSDDKKMGNDSVMDCTVNSGAVTVHSSYNLPGYSNELLEPDTFGITSKSGKVENGVLTCSFSRVRRFDLVSNGTRIKRVASSVDHFFDLDTGWYLFFAKGHTHGATIKKEMHDVLPAVSMAKADFQTLRDISTLETGSTKESPLSTTTLLQTMIPGFGASCLDHGCGITKGCFHDCNHGASWTFLVTWKDNGGDSVDFEMKAKIPAADNYWVSLGLSDDKEMGNDSVMDCIVNSGAVTVHSSYNLPGYSNELLEPDTFGITSKSGNVENGVLTCSFSRVRRFDLVSSGMRKKRVASSVDNFFDLDTDWYLFFAKGHTSEATIKKEMHDVLPAVSMAKADFQTLRDISSLETGSTKESPLSTNTLLQTMIPGFGASCLDHGCGITKGCFHDCNHGASWTFLVTWKDNGGDSVDFEMKAKIPAADNYWVSLGLSDDKEMGNDSVMDCIVNSGAVTVHSSYNLPGYSNELLEPDTFGITSKSEKVENGVLTCSFSRVRRFDLVPNGKRKKRVASSVDHFFDLDTDWYLFFAKGHTNGATMDKTMHVVPPAVSNVMADFQTMRDISSPYTVSTSMSPTLLRGGTCKDLACGGTKGCFHDCDRGAAWTFLITWADTGDNSINFEMKAKIPGIDNYWVSIGLSKDRLMDSMIGYKQTILLILNVHGHNLLPMKELKCTTTSIITDGDDSVMDCSIMNGVITAYNSYNAKNAKSNEALSNATYGIENKGGKVEDGIFTCSFSRLKTVSSISNSKRKKRAAVSADTFFDLNEDWYLLFAFGRTAGSATSKFAHSLTDLPKSSAVKADLQSMIDLSASKVKELLIKIHGILMIIAWVTLASIGIIVARFYKPVWPNSRLGGEKIWFQIHRFCMVFVLLCTAASFVLIFVQINGYSVIESSEFQRSHPTIGIVVMSLTVINPIMALFRPHPDDKKRPIFNFFHWGVGTSAHILAIINIFIGISLPKADISEKVTYILWTYVAWQVFLGIVLTVCDCYQKREEENYETIDMIEMRDFSYKYSVSGKKKKVTLSVKPPLLVFHVLVVLGLTVAIIVIGGLESS